MKKTFGILLTATMLVGCTSFSAPAPRSLSMDTRLETLNNLPMPAFHKPVEILWNSYQVPYIIAEDDQDAAFALGLIQAHLRLGQMEFFKRVSQGRLSEMAGPFTTDIDAALRLLGYGRAASDIVRAMPEKTRVWMDAYVAGVNYYKDNVPTRPSDFKAFNFAEEPWTIEDSITVGRLAGSDFSWRFLPALLEMRGTPEWEVMWNRFEQHGDQAVKVSDAAPQATPSSRGFEQLAFLSKYVARTGSNSFAIAPERSQSGAAMIANDPHLGFVLPNAWVMAGIKSPSYHSVGMMIPGLPVMAFGRTECLAWGGTNAISWNTDLIDLSAKKTVPMETETHDISVRWWFDSESENRVSEYGPIISDAEALGFEEDQLVAARWIGHYPSDEVTAMLNVMQLDNGLNMRKALQTFALPAQNMIFADCDGNIGHVLATWLPNRPAEFPADIITTPEQADQSWATLLNSTDLPYRMNPQEGYVVSANNRTFDNPPTRLGLIFSSSQRVERLKSMIEAQQTLAVEDLSKIQADVYSANAHKTAKVLTGYGVQDEELEAVRALIQSWDGYYTIDSRGAFAYEAVLYHLVEPAYAAHPDLTRHDIWQESGYLDLEIRRVLADLPEAQRAELITQAMYAARSEIMTGDTWGDRHRLNDGHVFGRVPVLGSAYRGDDFPASGGRETVKKSGDGLEIEEHSPAFGSQSRHISDMSHPDHNYFALFGGQDGVFGSVNFADQMPLWHERQYIQMPLSMDQVRAQFLVSTSFSEKN